MSTQLDLGIDVTEAVGLGEALQTRATVVLPEPDALGDPPVVCFGFPGGGYSRAYFTFDMPGASGGGEAGVRERRRVRRRRPPRAYPRSPDVTVYICPRMAHMHNFASTREAFWQRLHAWGSGIAAARNGERGGRRTRS